MHLRGYSIIPYFFSIICCSPNSAICRLGLGWVFGVRGLLTQTSRLMWRLRSPLFIIESMSVLSAIQNLGSLWRQAYAMLQILICTYLYPWRTT